MTHWIRFGHIKWIVCSEEHVVVAEQIDESCKLVCAKHNAVDVDFL